MTTANAKNVKKTFTTPVVTLLPYCYIQKADFGNEKFPKPRGEYTVKCTIPADKAQGLMDFISKVHDENYQKYLNVEKPKAQALAKQQGKRFNELSEGNLPFFELEDGVIAFTFKMHASYVDKKTKETKELTLRVYDAAGKRIMDVPQPCKGSEGRVVFSFVPYMSAVAGCGVKLQIEKFQLLKLVEWQPEDTMEAMEDYEGGFIADSFSSTGGDDFGGSTSDDSNTESEAAEESNSYGYDF